MTIKDARQKAYYKTLLLIARLGALEDTDSKADVIDAFVEDAVTEILLNGSIETPRMIEIVSDVFGVSEEHIEQFCKDLSDFVKQLWSSVTNEDMFNPAEFEDSIDLTIQLEDTLGKQIWSIVDTWCESNSVEKIDTILLKR
jgi:hypothetical protein